MPYVLTTQAQVLCPHGGWVTLTPSSPELDIGGHPVLGPSDAVVIDSCPFTTDDGSPHPCDTVEWIAYGTYAGVTVLTSESVGLTSAAGTPHGQVTIAETQTDVEAGAFESTGAYVLTTASTMTCPHGGTLQIHAQAQTPVIEGYVVLQPSDPLLVVGCPDSEEPCLDVQWTNPLDWRFAGLHVLTTKSIGITNGGSPGLVQVLVFQTRAEADRG